MTTPLHPTNKSTPHQLRVATNHPLPRAGFAACEGPASPLPPARQSQRAIPASSTMPRTEEAGICAPRSPSAHNKTRVGRGREGAAPPRVVETANGHGWGRCASANATAPSFVQANKKQYAARGWCPSFLQSGHNNNTKTSKGHGDATSKGGYRGSNEQQLPPATTTTTTAKDTEIRGAQRGTKKPNTIRKYTRSNRMQ